MECSDYGMLLLHTTPSRYYDSFNYVKEKARLAREANYPYKATDGVCDMSAVANDLGTAKLTGYVEVLRRSRVAELSK